MSTQHTCPTCSQKVDVGRLVAEECSRIREWAERHQHTTHPLDSLRLDAVAQYMDFSHTQSLRNSISEKRIDLTPIKIGGRVRVTVTQLANVSVQKGLNF